MTIHWHDSDAAQQYVAGTLPRADVEAFEEHLLACGRCRSDVRAGAAVRIALSAEPAGAVRRASPVHIWRRRTIFAAAAAAAAVLVIALVNRESRVARLGAIDPPAFVSGALRAPADSATDLVDRGMAAYAARDFAGAAALLSRAAAVDSSAGVAFHLGVALLMQNENERALESLLRARRPAGNAYADEALFFAVKALIRQRQTDSALALIRSAPRDGPIGAHMRALGDSIVRR